MSHELHSCIDEQKRYEKMCVNFVEIEKDVMCLLQQIACLTSYEMENQVRDVTQFQSFKNFKKS